MTSRLPAQCTFCVHWISPLSAGVGATLADRQVCAAYPDGIPDDIWWNQADHREAQPGDNGIQWEPVDSESAYPDFVLSAEG